MTAAAFVRRITIDRPLADVVRFLSLVPNLPRWTRYFRCVSAGEHGGYSTITPRGPGLTRIALTGDDAGERRARDETVLRVRTTFADREDSADLRVVPTAGGGAEVTFVLRPPAGVDAAAIAAMLDTLSMELEVLRDVLEAGRGTGEEAA